MNALVIYDSQYGNTEEIARAIAEVLREHGPVHVILASEAGSLDFRAADFIAVGGPTQAHGPSHAIKRLFEAISNKAVHNTPALAFDTRFHLPGWVSGMASGDIEAQLHRIGCQLIMPHESFFVEGKVGPLSDGELERAASWARIALGKLRLLDAVGSQI